MGWTNDQTNEIVIPAGTPFLPGNNVIGIGTQLPAELIAYGVQAAIVFYSTDWDPNATVPTIKFGWIGIGPNIELLNPVAILGTAISMGLGVCANPHASQVAKVTSGLSLGMFSDGTGELFAAFNNSQNNVTWVLSEAVSTHNATEQGFSNTGAGLWSLPGFAG